MTYRDHFVELFELKERAEEDVFFARRDRELIERLREMKQDEGRKRLLELTRSRCPECGRHLETQSINGVSMQVCPMCHGAWVHDEKLTSSGARSSQWARSFLFGLMHLVEHPFG